MRFPPKFAVALITLAFPLAGDAATRTWDGEADNNWDNGTNWAPDGVPALTDDLTIASGTPSKAVNATVDGGSVTISGGDVTWAGRFNTIGNVAAGSSSLLITSGSLTVNYNGGLSHSFNVGNVAAGTLQQQGGTVTAANDNDEIFLGNQALGDGTYEISGGILNAGRVYNGNAGTGTFHIIGDASTINLTGSAGTSYSQNASSTLKLDIDSGISPIAASGNVILDGALEVTFLATPSVGQSFTIMSYGGSLTGAFGFDGLGDSPLGPDTVMLSIGYGTGAADAVVLTVDAGPEPLVLKIGQSGGNLDFEWNSLDGMQYDLLSSTDLSTDPATWLPYNDGVTTYENIPATGTTTTLSGVLKVGPTRFFALIEEEIPPLFEENFESGDGSFTVATDSGTPWAHGGPDSNGAGGEVTTGNGDSANCWATNPGAYAGGTGDEGYFADSTVTRLRSRVIDLTGMTAAELSFAEALDLEQDQVGDSPGTVDSAEVYIIDDTDDNTATNVIAGPIYSAADGDVNDAAWATANGGTPITIPGAALGQAVRIEWRFTGFGGTTDDYMGWYIDDVVVTATP